MKATIIKIDFDKKKSNKPLSPLQQKIMSAPVMTKEEYEIYKKNNKWMGKWKV